jgi:uncharacterized protein YbjT (DUF2867 family)
MSSVQQTVLIVGASGRLAGLVVPAAAKKGAEVRALIRRENDAQAVRACGASDVALGDLRDPHSLTAAAWGVDAVFHIGPAFQADEAELGLNIVRAAKDAGVRRFVFSGVIHPTNRRLSNHASKQPVEEALFASGMEYVILHPTTLFQNLDAGWPMVLERAVFAEPFSVAVRMARVDYRDVAEVAAMALLENDLTYGTYELCSPELPDREQVAGMMGEVLGRRIRAAQIGFEEWIASAKLPYDSEQQRALARVFEYFDAYGSAGNSMVLRTILGREPRTLRQYIEDLAAARRTTAFDLETRHAL